MSNAWPYGDPLAMVRHALCIQIPSAAGSRLRGRQHAAKVLVFLALSADQDGASWYGSTAIAEKCGLSDVRRAKEALAVLVEADWIAREQRPGTKAAITRLTTPATRATSRTRSTNKQANSRHVPPERDRRGGPGGSAPARVGATATREEGAGQC